MTIDVSVVVPVYNAELYLRECIESLIYQTLRSVEFIFVDDGSTDQSINIIEKYQQFDSRIQVIKQNNINAGVARNNGMKRAKGKYIIFLDSDDFFDLKMLERAFVCAERRQAEITFFNYSWFDNVSKKVYHPKFESVPKGIFSIRDIGDGFFNINRYTPAPWNKLYLRSFIDENKLEYQSIRKFNDTYFVCLSAFVATRITKLNSDLMYYRHNNKTSLQGNYQLDRTGFISPLFEIKRQLIARGLFEKEIIGAYTTLVKEYVERLLMYDASSISLEQYRYDYNEVRTNLVKTLFDSEEQFKNESALLDIYNNDFDAYLYSELRRCRRANSEVLNSREFRIGKRILYVPRKIKNLIVNRFVDA